MRFDDFDIVIVTENAGASLQSFQQDIDADTHVRRQDTACFFGQPADNH